MGLHQELGLPNAIATAAHEAALNVVMTGTLMTKEGGRVLRPFGLTDSQFNVLMLLKHQSDDGRLSHTKLGKMLLVNRSNVTGLVDRMEQAGWVTRRGKSGDRRVKQVALSPAGQRLLERAERAYFERIEEVMGALPPRGHVRLCRLLERVRERIRTGNGG